MKFLIYKNVGIGSLALRSLWLFAAAIGIAIQPVSAQAQSYKRLYSFTKDSADGQNPSSSLVRDPEGNLYGIALGGTFGEGGVFELSNPGELSNTWQESVLHSFNQSDGDGYPPDSMSFRDAAGNLFGTTFQGGASSYGPVFKRDPW